MRVPGESSSSSALYLTLSSLAVAIAALMVSNCAHRFSYSSSLVSFADAEAVLVDEAFVDDEAADAYDVDADADANENADGVVVDDETVDSTVAFNEAVPNEAVSVSVANFTVDEAVIDKAAVNTEGALGLGESDTL